VELVPHIGAVVSVIVGAGGIALITCIGLWLLFCRWVVNSAIKRGEKPDPVEVIRAASLGMIGRSSKTPALPPPPKSGDTSLAAQS
jgi:hypothetical protein